MWSFEDQLNTNNEWIEASRCVEAAFCEHFVSFSSNFKTFEMKLNDWQRRHSYGIFNKLTESNFVFCISSEISDFLHVGDGVNHDVRTELLYWLLLKEADDRTHSMFGSPWLDASICSYMGTSLQNKISCQNAQLLHSHFVKVTRLHSNDWKRWLLYMETAGTLKAM